MNSSHSLTGVLAILHIALMLGQSACTERRLQKNHPQWSLNCIRADSKHITFFDQQKGGSIWPKIPAPILTPTAAVMTTTLPTAEVFV